MGFLRRNMLYRLFCIVLAVHIFNISVDMPDAQPDFIPEDLSVNDMESVVEIVLEKGMGIENAIAEHDEPDEEGAGSLELVKDFKVYPVNHHTISFRRSYTLWDVKVPYSTSYISKYVSEINPPPPKA